MAEFNAHVLREALTRAARAAFSEVRAKHRGEDFYCIGIFTDGLFSYLGPTAMTEQGLDEAVRRYQKMPRYENERPELLRFSLRWSPCDSPLHLEGEKHFQQLDGILGDIAKSLCSIDIDAGWDEFDDYVARVRDVIVEVLVQLDREGAYGSEAEREKIFVTMLMGDQDGSILDIGRRINPPATVRNFETEWRKWNELWKSR